MFHFLTMTVDSPLRVQESDVVRDAIYALQGLPAAVRKLERLSSTYCTTSADKSAHSLSTLWTRSVTASALGKVLAVVARAGYVRLQLEAFVSFFLDGRADPDEGDSDVSQKRKKKKALKKERRKKRAAATAEEEAEKQPSSSEFRGNSGAVSVDKVSRHCLVNQAFAVAVRGILRGHSAALNTLSSSICVRRAEGNADTFQGDLRNQDPGPVIRYGSGDISLLEFFLHTRELRVQLQALAFICLVRDGKSFVVTTANDFLSEHWIDPAVNEREHSFRKGGSRVPKDMKAVDRSDSPVRSFDNFPRGADLLTYLYDQLVEADPHHMELLRFLFERAYEPYSIFIQSWLYQAAVRDPYGEFIIEQADFNGVSPSSVVKGERFGGLNPADVKDPMAIVRKKPTLLWIIHKFCIVSSSGVSTETLARLCKANDLRRGLHMPRFLDNMCTPLIRAGEQLQVLLKLAETCELAQQMACNTRTSELFWPQNSTPSVAESRSLYLPALSFSKKKLNETVNQMERKSQEMSEQCDTLFTALASRRLEKERSRTASHTSGPENLSVGDGVTQMDDKQVPVAGSELQQQIYQQPSANLPASQELTYSKDEITVTLPKRGWVTSAEGLDAEDDSLSHPKRKSQNCWQIGKDGVLALTMKEGIESGNMVSSDVTPDVISLQLDRPGLGQTWFPADSSSACEVEEKLKSQTGKSLISDYQRGTSWPVWGLPINPFLVQEADVDDFTANIYSYPTFTGTYHHWDVTTKSTMASVPSNPVSGLDKSRESNVEPPWFTGLESSFHDQVCAGLDAHLKLASWDQLDVGHCEDETGQLAGLDHLDQPVVGWDKLLTPPLAESSESVIPAALQTAKSFTDSLSFSSVVQPESNVQEDLASSQRPINPHNFSSGSQLKSEALADLASPQGTHVQDLQGSEAELETENGGSTGFLLEGTEKCSLETNLMELDTFSMEGQESGIIENVKRPSGFEPDGDTSTKIRMGLAALASESSGFDQREVVRLSDQEKPVSLGNENILGPAKWEQYLQFSDVISPDPMQETIDIGIDEDDGYADTEIPLTVVISKCVAKEILSQYQSVSILTVRLFQEGLRLQDHYAALRRYFFMERGDWAEYFTTALCQQRLGPLDGQLRQMEVQGILEAAFQKSSCEGDEYAERVHVSFQESAYYCENLIHGSTKTSMSAFVDCSRLDAFDFITLEYRVDWPLNIILTSHSLQLYNVVFTFLMRMKLTVHALGDIWQQLQVIDRSLLKERGSSVFLQQRNRFRTFQQFRQQIYHFVTAVQRYVESKLLNVVWSKFLQAVQLEVSDMQDLEIVHSAYVEEAIDECFLSKKTGGVKGCIDDIMQCVLDFSLHMRNAFNQSAQKLELIDNGLFMQVHQVRKVFHSSLQQLHDYHMKQEPQSKNNLNDLWMILDFNGFLTTALSTPQL